MEINTATKKIETKEDEIKVEQQGTLKEQGKEQGKKQEESGKETLVAKPPPSPSFAKKPQVRKTARIVFNTSKGDFTTLPANMRDDTVKKIGSEFKKSADGVTSTRDVIRGLDITQEKILLPEIIGVPHDHANFLKTARDFWIEFKVVPEPKPGKLLNYTTYEVKIPVGIPSPDGETMYQAPVNPYEYMEYLFCMQSTKVAKTPPELANLGLYDFYLIDEGVRKEEEAKLYSIKEDADMLFVTLIKGGEAPSVEELAKIDWVIQVLKDPSEFLNLQYMELVDKKMWLRTSKDKDPANFVKVVSDSNLKYKALRVMLVERTLIRYEGDYYYYHDENLGRETGIISWLKDPKNSEKVRDLKTRLEDRLKKEKTQLQT
ncbi:hypothetical protein LCGC14_0245410 [marine sediment metagenome]|uniref:Uncharacterized protein n=1 Tax=marine sediment metagenome TaxID=412755 RepID=A0A0F9U621_9ZZZZ